MKLGLDFDNTLINYDRLIRAVAVERGLIDPASPLHAKQELRDAIRRQPDGDLRWQEIQSYIYSDGIARADCPEGLEGLGALLRQPGIETWIVSHKTITAPFDPHQHNLRSAALAWMESHGFFDPQGLNLKRAHVVFADTKEQKIELVRELKFTVLIDDLAEILDHPRFPTNIRRILYTPAPMTDSTADHADSWDKIVEFLSDEFSTEKLRLAIAEFTAEDFQFTRVSGGRNSRCFRIAAGARPDEAIFLKQYFRSAHDTRNRLATEYRALEFMRTHQLECVPCPLFRSEETHSAGYLFVEGTHALLTEITERDIKALLTFLRHLHALRKEPGAAEIGPASEACFSLADIGRNLTARFERLLNVQDERLQEFLVSLTPTLHATLEEAADKLASLDSTRETKISRELQTLSPSDVGFHNAIRLADGGMIFIDFEYFGWDDPAKLICDFLLQPEQKVSAVRLRQFCNGAYQIYGDASLAPRVQVYLPLFRLKWVMILLNEFLQDSGARRTFAASKNVNGSLIARSQLEKARRMALYPLPSVA